MIKLRTRIFTITIILGFLLLFFGCTTAENKNGTSNILENNDSPQNLSELKSSSIEVGYEDLLRNNETYVNKVLHIPQLRIMQVVGDGPSVIFLANIIDNESSPSTVYLNNYNGNRLLKGDNAEVYVIVEGIKIYESTSGKSVNVPQLKIIELTRCGTEGLEPCDTNSCGLDYELVGPVCKKICGYPEIRIDGVCVSCGGTNEPCCKNNYCFGGKMYGIGVTCSDKNICENCGRTNEICCSGSDKCSLVSGDNCVNGICINKYTK